MTLQAFQTHRSDLAGQVGGLGFQQPLEDGHWAPREPLASLLELIPQSRKPQPGARLKGRRPSDVSSESTMVVARLKPRLRPLPDTGSSSSMPQANCL